MAVKTSAIKPFKMTPNPCYGTGIYRRRVRLCHESKQQVLAEMEDDIHGFRIALFHDGHTITAINPQPQRVPLDTCTGANAVLKTLVGTSLSTSPRALLHDNNPRAHCTHQFDLLGLAITHALRNQPVRQYDIAIHDAHEGIYRTEGCIDGKPTFLWRIRNNVIETEGAWMGISTHKGFANWAEQNLPVDQLELALIVQRGLMVATTRHVLIDELEGSGLEDDPMPKGVCYSYSEPVLFDAVRLGNVVRDFTDTPEQLLRFV